MSHLVIAIDCDDVLVEATEYLVATYNALYGTHVLLEHAHTSKNPEWEAERDEVLRRLGAIQQSDEYGSIAPTQQTIDAVKQLSSQHELHLVTARPEVIVGVTQVMIDTYFSDCFFSVEHVGPDRSKGEVCKRLGADILIDDNLKHLEAAKTNEIKGLIWFGSYPWQDPQVALPEGVVRCGDWQAVMEFVDVRA